MGVKEAGLLALQLFRLVVLALRARRVGMSVMGDVCGSTTGFNELHDGPAIQSVLAGILLGPLRR